eukprot:CAMPEP_0176150534 /NCGR_PEP_ID=MMETSP0120_2-20121206/76858_1 /TAXON_ID=160619 /ORGANISM="Kryptoperidinium foliaceum, Strain CCMP 1326" /LENGTH=90 /DNA_ID=CAMNT_0017487449 /DNA_START=24 /DNA_END=293 /DNA_ORIENTATION=+
MPQSVAAPGWVKAPMAHLVADAALLTSACDFSRDAPGPRSGRSLGPAGAPYSYVPAALGRPPRMATAWAAGFVAAMRDQAWRPSWACGIV